MSEPSDSQPQLGPEFQARYRLERLLGAGAMGSVWLAHDLALDRPVAAKFLRPEIMGTDGLRRFFEEALALARLEHPAILRIFDAGDRNTHPYLVTEFVDGGALTVAIRQQHPLPWPRYREWALALCNAMTHSHGQGILHRDLKTENILLTREGDLRVADFGLARRNERASALTATGKVMGTPAYMAPELLKGGPATTATDLYAGSICLYVMATGKLPFPDENVGDVLRAQLDRRAPDPRIDRPDMSSALAELLLRALSKTPEDRPASFEALGEELRRVEASRHDRAGATMEMADRTRRAAREARQSRDEATRILDSARRSAPSHEGRAPTERRLGKGAGAILALLLLALGASFFPSTGPVGVKGLVEVERKVHADGITLSWTTSEAKALRYEIVPEGGPSRLLEGERRASTVHHLTVTDLEAGQSYRCIVRHGASETQLPFRTPPPRLIGPIRSRLFQGALSLRYESNLLGPLRLLTTRPGYAQERHELPARGPVILPKVGSVDMPFLTWELQYEGSSLAIDTIRCASSATSLVGRTEGCAVKSRPQISRAAYPVQPPVWMGSRFFVLDSLGTLNAFEVPETRPRPHETRPMDSPPTLRRAFVLRAPHQGGRREFERACGGLVVLPRRKELVYFTLQKTVRPEKGRILVSHVDPESRSRSWSSWVPDLPPGELPTWIEDPSHPWNAPLGDTEAAVPLAVEGAPWSPGLRLEKLILLGCKGSRAPALLGYDPEGRRLAFFRGGLTELLDRSPYCLPPTNEERHWSRTSPYLATRLSWDLSSPLVRRGERVYLVVSRELKEGSRSVALVSWALDGTQAQAHFRFRSTQSWFALPEEGDDLDLIEGETLFTWPVDGSSPLPRHRCLRHLLPPRRKEDDPTKARAYMTGNCLRIGKRTLLTQYRYRSFMTDTSDLLLCQIFGTDADPSRIHRGMRLREMQLAGHRNVRQVMGWENLMIVLSAASCCVVDLKKSRCNTWVPLGRFRHGSLRHDGLLACATSRGEVFAIPVELVVLATSNREDSRLSPPLLGP